MHLRLYAGSFGYPFIEGSFGRSPSPSATDRLKLVELVILIC